MQESSLVLAASVVARLRGLGIPERRAAGLGPARSSLEILGVPVPDLRRVVKALAAEHRTASASAVLDLAEALVTTRVHEAAMVAFELVGGHRQALSSVDLSCAESLGRANDNWASVDTFSVYVSGPAWRRGTIPDAGPAAWAASPNRWWRRTALASTVPLNMRSRGGTGDAKRTLDICERLVSDRDDMVIKALSWALRELLEHEPDEVAAFLLRHGDHVHARVRREIRNKLETGRKNP
jgi:3-methyladenine DNA glycosylase AlkD